MIERYLLGVNKALLTPSSVFSPTTYTGNGSARTITNGIDLTNGGLVWIKQRAGSQDHTLFDTARGVNNYLRTNSTGAQNPGGAYSDLLTAFGSLGFSLGADASTAGFVNGSGSTYASWTFRKAPKFFDIVTWTGTGSARTISHNLGCVPGMIIVKRTDTTSDWPVYHNGHTSAAYYTKLNLTDAQTSDTTVWNSTAPTSSVFSVGTSTLTNASAGTYVAYLFAASNSGGFSTGSIVACGSFTTDASGASALVSIGWQPRYLLIKRVNASSSGSQDYWQIFDSARGLYSGATVANEPVLFPNTLSSELSWPVVSVSASGFQITNQGYVASNSTFIYLAIA